MSRYHVHWRRIDGKPHVKFAYDPNVIARLKNAIFPSERKWNAELKAWMIKDDAIPLAVEAIGPRPMCPRCAQGQECDAWKPPPPPKVKPSPYPEDDWRNFDAFLAGLEEGESKTKTSN